MYKKRKRTEAAIICRAHTTQRKNSRVYFRPGIDHVGLKIKAEWLLQMRQQYNMYTQPKTIERRRYPPSKYLRLGDVFYFLCGHEVWGGATLKDVCIYRSVEEFKADTDKHHIASGSTTCESFAGIFSESGRVLYGYVLENVFFFDPRPCSSEAIDVDGDIVHVPAFFGQRHGQAFFTGILPRLHSQHAHDPSVWRNRMHRRSDCPDAV